MSPCFPCCRLCAFHSDILRLVPKLCGDRNVSVRKCAYASLFSISRAVGCVVRPRFSIASPCCWKGWSPRKYFAIENRLTVQKSCLNVITTFWKTKPRTRFGDEYRGDQTWLPKFHFSIPAFLSFIFLTYRLFSHFTSASLQNCFCFGGMSSTCLFLTSDPLQNFFRFHFFETYALPFFLSLLLHRRVSLTLRFFTLPCLDAIF